ncbi:hypothetical protein [Nicoliella lavandulae]|uniref:Tetratricopeptide repeat protein n=1 Tax=Nicoliella lavandulae TaxID=3082954 RepID=A0ABU8SLH2_9LACO
MNYDQLWKAIYDNLDQHHYSIAVTDLKKIYENDPSKKANQLLVKALVADKSYLEAKEYMLEMINDYRDSLEDFELMVKVFILNQNFIQSQIMINTVNDLKIKSILQQRLDKASNQYVEQHGDVVDQLTNALYHIGGSKLSHQSETLVKAMNLPVKAYFNAAKGALTDPYLNPAIRFNLLDVLRELQLSDEIEISWIDGQLHQINLSQLVPLAEMKSSKAIFRQLEIRFGQNSPDLLQNMVKTFNLFLAYLYPFSDQIISDYDRWITVAYDMQRGQRPDLKSMDSETKSIYEWQQKLLKLVDSIK